MNIIESPASAPEIGIGSTIWYFDEDHRVYAPGGRGAPIYREHWRQIKIEGETSNHWLVGRRGKVLKKGPHHGFAFTAEEVEDDVWLNAYRYSISDAVKLLHDAKTLRKVAALIGFNPQPATKELSTQ